MASKQEIARARNLAHLFNAGAKVYNPGGYTAQVDELGDDDGYTIEIFDAAGDLEDTLSSVAEFSEWIQDQESGYVD